MAVHPQPLSDDNDGSFQRGGLLQAMPETDDDRVASLCLGHCGSVKPMFVVLLFLCHHSNGHLKFTAIRYGIGTGLMSVKYSSVGQHRAETD